MKSTCNRCGKVCTFESDFVPTKCIRNGRITYAWKEVPANQKVVTDAKPLLFVLASVNEFKEALSSLVITTKGN